MLDQHIRARLKIIQSRNFKSKNNFKGSYTQVKPLGRGGGAGGVWGGGGGKTIHVYELYRYVPLLRDGMVFKQFSQG